MILNLASILFVASVVGSTIHTTTASKYSEHHARDELNDAIIARTVDMDSLFARHSEHRAREELNDAIVARVVDAALFSRDVLEERFAQCVKDSDCVTSSYKCIDGTCVYKSGSGGSRKPNGKKY